MPEVEIVSMEDAKSKPLDITPELAMTASKVLLEFCKNSNGCHSCHFGKEPQCPFGTPFLWDLSGTQ